MLLRYQVNMIITKQLHEIDDNKQKTNHKTSEIVHVKMKRTDV